MGTSRRARSPGDEDTRLARLDAQIQAYEVLAAALEQRQEVFQVLEAAADLEVARRRLQEVLGTDSAGAQWVLDMPLRRIPRSERDKVTAELENLRRERADAR
jgi:DNA gyrase/topoisomerase IV subunit A